MASASTQTLLFVSTTTIPGVFCGINFSLYFLCIRLFYQQYRKAPDEFKKRVVSLICNSVMVLMAGLELGTDSGLVQLEFINHINTPGVALEVKNTVVFSLNNTSFVVIPIFNSLVQSWRIWIIWDMSPYKLVVTIVPLLLQIASQAVNISGLTIVTSSNPEEVYLLAVILIALGLASNLLVTLLLVARIIVRQRRNNHLMGTTSENSNQYTTIVAILVESYALDCIWTAAAVITFVLSLEGIPLDDVSAIFNNAGDQVTVFAFLLVSYRVLSNQAWTPQTGRQLSTLRWNHDDPEATVTMDLTTAPDHLSSR